MADDLNPDNIRGAQRSLDDYNNSLRESINYSRELVKQIGKLPESFNLSDKRNKELVKNIQDYEKTLKNTLILSNKISKGRASERDITKQLNVIQENYNQYRKEEGASFESNRGRFLSRQIASQKEIDKLEQSILSKRKEINKADASIDDIRSRILTAETIAAITTSSTQQEIQRDRIKFLKGRLKEEENTIKSKEKGIKIDENSILKEKTKKEEIDKVLTLHKKIKKAYEDEINTTEALLAAQREQQSTIYAINEIVNGIKDKFAAAFTPLSILTTGFELFKKAAFTASENVTKLQKGLVLSREEAYELRDSFNNIAVSSDDIAVNTNRLIEANAALGKQLGFNSRFTTDMNVQFVKLTKQIGLSEEAAGGLAKLSRATGITLEDAKNVALGTSQALSSQYGIQLDQREVLEEIGKISGQTLAFFKASPQAIAQAVAQAKLLGTNLSIASKQASSLLNFESSIESELQAELLTGRQLNLERARTAALTGDLTTVMQELNNQNIDFNKFSNMNAIAQNKVAEALGLSSDELADQLLKQQYLGKSREEIAALAGEEVAQRLEALSAQDKFNLAVEKMQDIVGRLVGGPLGKFADAIASMAENSFMLYSTLSLIAGISLTKLITGLAASAVQAGFLAAGSVTTASALTFGVTALAIAAGIGAIMAAYSSAKEDAQEFADGGVIYGKTKAIVGEYAGVENNPEVIAPLSDLQNILDRNRVVVNNQGSQETLSAIQMLNDTMKSVKESISQLNSKEGIVNINGQRAGTAQLMGNYNLA